MNNQEGDWCTKRRLPACSTLTALYYAVDHSLLLQFIYLTFAKPGRSAIGVEISRATRPKGRQRKNQVKIKMKTVRLRFRGRFPCPLAFQRSLSNERGHVL